MCRYRVVIGFNMPRNLLGQSTSAFMTGLAGRRLRLIKRSVIADLTFTTIRTGSISRTGDAVALGVTFVACAGQTTL